MSIRFLAFWCNPETIVEQIREAAKDLLPQEESIEIQLFTLASGKTVFRVLEAGYGLRNILWKNPGSFPQCNYYDVADVPDEDLPNLAIAEEVDELIAQNRYQIIQVVPACTA